MPEISHNEKQIKKDWTHRGAMVLPFKPAGTIHAADEAQTLLGSSTAHSCCCNAGQQGPRVASASAALANESRFWTFLVFFILKGRGQAQHLECFDRCHL